MVSSIIVFLEMGLPDEGFAIIVQMVLAGLALGSLLSVSPLESIGVRYLY
jgi:hypothetical protein